MYEGIQGAEDVCKIKSREHTFMTGDFQTCRKLATTVFRQHKLSGFHKEVDKQVITPRCTCNNGHIGVAITCSEFFGNE